MQEMPKIKAPFDYSGSSSIKKRLLAVSLLILLSLWTLYMIEKSKEKTPPITSLFYQPLLTDKIDWEMSFKEMNSCQIETLIIQWSQFGVVDFVKDDTWLNEILTQAERYHIAVVVGLYGDDHYFKMLESPQTNREVYFQKLLKLNTQQAKKIYTIAKKHPSFKGWYVYDEIDDTNFAKTKQIIQLKSYLQKLALNLESISPQPRYISGYFSQHMSPKEYSKMFSDITEKKYTLLLQSGIGANLVNSERSSHYIQLFKENFKGEFIPIVEGFKMLEKETVPSDFKSLKEQIEQIQKASEQNRLSLFSLRYFLDSKLLKDYKEAYIQ